MSDKRKVSTDALETLGTIITPNEKRDAIHLAVIPAQAVEAMDPGDRISYKDGRAVLDKDGIGIVDPFLPRPVRAGQTFWMVLRPRLITSLRHVWTHPALPDEPGISASAETDTMVLKAASEQWIRDFLTRVDGPGYEVVLAAAVSEYNDDDSLHLGVDASGDIPPEFWDHVETVTGKKITNRPTYFTCSC